MNTYLIERRLTMDSIKHILGHFLICHPKATLYTLFASLFIGVICIFALRPTPELSAHADHLNNKYFTTVTVSSGDTLWDIADEYRTVEYASVQEYIDEVKEINQIHGDEITAGCTLVVPYYAESPIE